MWKEGGRGGKRYGVVYAMIQCKSSQVYQCVCVSVTVSVSVWQEVVAYYCITNDRQPPPRRHLAARMRQLTYLSAQDMKRLRYCRQLFICRYPYTRTLKLFTVVHSYVGSLCGDRQNVMHSLLLLSIFIYLRVPRAMH